MWSCIICDFVEVLYKHTQKCFCVYDTLKQTYGDLHEKMDTKPLWVMYGS